MNRTGKFLKYMTLGMALLAAGKIFHDEGDTVTTNKEVAKDQVKIENNLKHRPELDAAEEWFAKAKLEMPKEEDIWRGGRKHSAIPKPTVVSRGPQQSKGTVH